VTQPAVIVCAGGGGVGKTTTSAAIALAVARTGRRVLIVSLDPARRLADALGVALGTKARELSVDAKDGVVFGLMPDPRDSLGTFAELLFEQEPAALDRLRENRIYRALEAAVPGVHELAAIGLTWRAVDQHSIDVVVIDTAPSRNAVDFIGQPGRLAKLLRGRAVAWLSNIGQQAGSSTATAKLGRVESLLVRVIGPAVRDVAALFTELARVRERFLWINEKTGELLLRPDTRYFLVAAPTAAAREDASFLFKKLRQLEVSPRGLILNSAFVPPRQWLDVLDEHDSLSASVRSVLDSLQEEARIRDEAASEVSTAMARRHPRLTQLRLPFVEAAEPRQIVEALSAALDVERLLGRTSAPAVG
jgi:anion-transporting  ArsA/GET3 family ATPase